MLLANYFLPFPLAQTLACGVKNAALEDLVQKDYAGLREKYLAAAKTKLQRIRSL